MDGLFLSGLALFGVLAVTCYMAFECYKFIKTIDNNKKTK